MSKHTSTPWRAEAALIYSEETGKTIVVAPGVRCDEEAPEDLKYMVHCVNCHDELVEVLKEASRYIEVSNQWQIHDVIKKALAKAESEK